VSKVVVVVEHCLVFTRREEASDIPAIGAVHSQAFADAYDGRPGQEPPEVRLVEELRAGPDWLAGLSLVAVVDGSVVGHLCCTRGRLDGVVPALGLGPLGVLPSMQRRGVGQALMYTLLGAAMALDEPVVCLLGDPGYYRRFGFIPASRLGIQAPDESWGDYFQARALLQHRAAPSGSFSYPEAFDRVSS
jgi:putative acetyltransferase